MFFSAIGLRKRWKHIRDNYKREYSKKRFEKGGSGAATVRKEYIYYSQLSFLSPICDIKPAKSNVNTKEEADIQTTRSDVRNDLQKLPAKKKRPCADDSLVNAFSTSTYKQHEDPKEDSEKHFLMSLVPHLKAVPHSAKLDCQCELMQVIKKYQTLNINNPHLDQYSYFQINSQQRIQSPQHCILGMPSTQAVEFTPPAFSPVGSESAASSDAVIEEKLF